MLNFGSPASRALPLAPAGSHMLRSPQRGRSMAKILPELPYHEQPPAVPEKLSMNAVEEKEARPPVPQKTLRSLRHKTITRRQVEYNDGNEEGKDRMHQSFDDVVISPFSDLGNLSSSGRDSGEVSPISDGGMELRTLIRETDADDTLRNKFDDEGSSPITNYSSSVGSVHSSPQRKQLWRRRSVRNNNKEEIFSLTLTKSNGFTNVEPVLQHIAKLQAHQAQSLPPPSAPQTEREYRSYSPIVRPIPRRPAPPQPKDDMHRLKEKLFNKGKKQTKPGLYAEQQDHLSSEHDLNTLANAQMGATGNANINNQPLAPDAFAEADKKEGAFQKAELSRGVGPSFQNFTISRGFVEANPNASLDVPQKVGGRLLGAFSYHSTEELSDSPASVGEWNRHADSSQEFQAHKLESRSTESLTPSESLTIRPGVQLKSNTVSRKPIGSSSQVALADTGNKSAAASHERMNTTSENLSKPFDKSTISSPGTSPKLAPTQAGKMQEDIRKISTSNLENMAKNQVVDNSKVNISSPTEGASCPSFQSPISPGDIGFKLSSGRPWPFKPTGTVPMHSDAIVPPMKLNKTQVECITKHRDIRESSNRFHSVGCAICGVMYKAERFMCTGCAVRFCRSCYQAMDATKDRDIKLMLKALGKEDKIPQ